MGWHLTILGGGWMAVFLYTGQPEDLVTANIWLAAAMILRARA